LHMTGQFNSPETREQVQAEYLPEQQQMHPMQSELTPGQIMERRIMGADSDVVLSAINSELASLQAQQNEAQLQQKRSFTGRIAEAFDIQRSVKSWAADNSRLAAKGRNVTSFPDYVKSMVEAGDDSESTLSAEHWLESGHYYRSVGEVLRQQDKRTSDAEQEGKTARADAEQARQKQSTDNARQAVEHARNVELFGRIVSSTKNKTQLETDVIDGFRFVGDGPKEQKHIGAGIPRIKELERGTDWRQHPNEAVSFTELVEPDEVQVHVPGRTERGRFGKKIETPSTFESQPNPNAGRAKMIHNEVTGQDEPAVRFRYQFSYSMQAIASRELPAYKEFRGSRPGQHLLLGVDLPKSLADQLQARLKTDPRSVRGLVQQLFLENNDGSVTQEYWLQGGDSQHPVRPPYEALPQDWNITMISGRETTSGGYQNRGDMQKDYRVERLPVSA
jgi:hypothetical protein